MERSDIRGKSRACHPHFASLNAGYCYCRRSSIESITLSVSFPNERTP